MLDIKQDVFLISNKFLLAEVPKHDGSEKKWAFLTQRSSCFNKCWKKRPLKALLLQSSSCWHTTPLVQLGSEEDSLHLGLVSPPLETVPLAQALSYSCAAGNQCGWRALALAGLLQASRFPAVDMGAEPRLYLLFQVLGSRRDCLEVLAPLPALQLQTL